MLNKNKKYFLVQVFLLISTTNSDETLSCPYLSLYSGRTRYQLRETIKYSRQQFAKGYHGLPAAAQMNGLVWNCETEYNLVKIQAQLPENNTTITYKNFGVNIAQDAGGCYLITIQSVVIEWRKQMQYVLPSLKYEGDSNLLQATNMAKWNATETACTYRIYDTGNTVWMLCVFNVKGAVDGETIYEKAKDGQYKCVDGAQCGTDGTCHEELCNVPNSNPDTLLSIYTPDLSCRNLPYMKQFSRYYALNLHNYYRRLVASGWAENKLTRFTPRASKMEALSYDCSLEEAANENVMKCERQPSTFGKVSADSGSNVYIIDDINITKEAALERAVVEWFGELSTHGVDPTSPWTGHPTVKNCANVMHDQYKTVGCAVNSCSSQGFTIVECRYGPKSLQPGGPIYDVGDPCTRGTGTILIGLNAEILVVPLTLGMGVAYAFLQILGTSADINEIFNMIAEQYVHTTVMLLVGVVLLQILTKNVGEALSCPYTPLLPEYWREILIRHQLNTRRSIAKGQDPYAPAAKQMNELVWNCETEYSLNKIREQLTDNSNDITYRNFGVNIGRDTYEDCSFSSISVICTDWDFENEYLNSSAIYDGNSDTLHIANMIKWNATEMACTFGSYNDGKSSQLICAYNVKGAVVGEAIYDVAKPGEYPCKGGAQCGTNGTCTDSLCKIPISNPGPDGLPRRRPQQLWTITYKGAMSNSSIMHLLSEGVLRGSSRNLAVFVGQKGIEGRQL
ncbi:hypothetical protein Q1695_004132 [Nippostrongylus brasiliensis]|nr:hypothetical protein Q1695_004132 [Nippostrongylus brasiliensis]